MNTSFIGMVSYFREAEPGCIGWAIPNIQVSINHIINAPIIMKIIPKGSFENFFLHDDSVILISSIPGGKI